MAINASDSQTQIGNYNEAQFKSIYALLFPPEIWNEWYEKYSDGFKVLDFLNMAGRTSSVRNRDYSHFEDGTDLRVATTRAQIGAGVAGAAIVFQLALTDYDANGNGPLRNNFSVYIPSTYQPAAVDVPRQYVVTGIAGAGAAQTNSRCDRAAHGVELAGERARAQARRGAHVPALWQGPDRRFRSG